MADELSGLQLREAVARLMGWRTGKYPDPEDPRFPVAVWLGDEVMHLGMPNGWTVAKHIEHVPHTIPHYESDIAAAWSVVEKMRDAGHFVEVVGRKGWLATVSTNAEKHRGLGDTAPEAICRAALAARAKA